MTHRVTIRMTGANNGSDEVYNDSDDTHLQCLAVYNNYSNNNWIENYTMTIVDDNTKEQIMDFDSSGRWAAYRSELQTITGGVTITGYTNTIVSEEDV